MDPSTHENEVSQIDGMDLDDIEVPMTDSSSTVALFEQSPEIFSVPLDRNFEDFDLGPSNPSNESLSMFDRFPEAFENLDENVQDTGSESPREPSDSFCVFARLPRSVAVDPSRLPYSWMIQQTRQMPEGGLTHSDEYCSKIPFPRHFEPSISGPPVRNVNGEKYMEAQLKSGLLKPSVYLFRAVSFRCIMDLNSQGLIHPTHFAAIIGRLFNGETRFLDVINRFFLPKEFNIVPVTRCSVMYDCLRQLSRHLDDHPAHARDPKFKTLVKVLHHLVVRRTKYKYLKDEIVGKLVYSSNGREFEPGAGAKMILSGVELSKVFLSRLSEWWPFRDTPWHQADEHGLFGTHRANGAKAAETLDPRLLNVRGMHRAWA
ncbi:hypothetical protein diail_4759 [Diaporthe ilicicola]|nr:hypothetical protein diail_4759 [Diaporthe ilicicola]